MASDLLASPAPALPADTFGPPSTALARAGAARKQISRKLKVGLDAIVWDGLPIDKAGEKAGLTTYSMRMALQRPHVIAYVKEQRQVFRESARGSNIHRAVAIRDQDDNRTAAMQALRYLDGLAPDEQAGGTLRHVTPGVVVQVNVNRGPAVVDDTVIEISPVGVPTDTASDGNGG